MEINNLHNINMERSVLSSILFNPACFEDIQSDISADVFYLPAHRYIYEAMSECQKEDLPIDEEFVRTKLLKNETWNEDAMLEIISTNPLPSTKAYVTEIKEKHQKRALVAMHNEVAKRIIENGAGAEETKLWIMQEIDKISGCSDTRAKSFSEYKQEVLNAPVVELVKTGIGFLDQPLSIVSDENFDLSRHGGFEIGRFVLLMGDPEAGKTMLGVQVMKYISQREPVLFFAFEFTVRNFVRTQLRLEGDEYENENLQIVDRGYDISDMLKEMRYWRKKGCRFVLIDSQMRVTNTAKRRATSEEIETEKFSLLAKAAQELDMVIVYICQQGKEDAKGGVITPMGSKKGGHEADIIIYLKKDKDSEDREIIFNKNKQTGKHFKKNITFSRESMNFRAIRNKEEKASGDEVPLSEAEKKPPEHATIYNKDGSQTKIDLN